MLKDLMIQAGLFKETLSEQALQEVLQEVMQDASQEVSQKVLDKRVRLFDKELVPVSYAKSQGS
jgi:hypothetical protein